MGFFNSSVKSHLLNLLGGMNGAMRIMQNSSGECNTAHWQYAACSGSVHGICFALNLNEEKIKVDGCDDEGLFLMETLSEKEFMDKYWMGVKA